MVKDFLLEDMMIDDSYLVPEKESVTIGRKREVDIIIPCRIEEAKSVSRIHCEIHRRDLEDEGGNIFVEDKGSKEGTYVNKTKIHTQTVLRDKDYLSLGPYNLRVRFFK